MQCGCMKQWGEPTHAHSSCSYVHVCINGTGTATWREDGWQGRGVTASFKPVQGMHQSLRSPPQQPVAFCVVCSELNSLNKACSAASA
eukprot:1162046-Pelagomonas_calceolata.AAC.6